MSRNEAKARAEARLDDALRMRGYADPRTAYRARLRELRLESPALFEEASRKHEETVVQAIAAGADAIDAWIAYGRFLGELSGAGSVMAVDETGRATPYNDGADTCDLVLFVPDDARTSVLPLAHPERPSPAQQATYDLLVLGRLSL